MKKIYDRFLFSDVCNPNPCRNRGRCNKESDGKSTCTCLNDFTGDNCELIKELGKYDLILPSNIASFSVFYILNFSLNVGETLLSFYSGGDCKNRHTYCANWQQQGYCTGKHETYMVKYCKEACGKCPGT